MTVAATWPEVESKVHRPGYWLAFSVGIVFLTLGIIGLFTIGKVMPNDEPKWIPQLCAAVFSLLGGLACLPAISGILWQVRVRHAAPEVLPDISREPVLHEGSTIHGRLTHELVEVATGWAFRPRRSLWRHDLDFLLGFGIPFLVLLTAMVSWSFHDKMKAGSWPACIFAAACITLLCGGTTLALIGLLMRASYHRLLGLDIPHRSGDLVLDIAEEPDASLANLSAALKQTFLGETRRTTLTISAERTRAVQLCPWKFVMGDSGDQSTTWAVQGVLVLANETGDEYCRLPLLVTGDFAGAARLMQELAGVLHVPYLFHADAADWQAEEQRSRKRPPLKSGGFMS